MSKVRKVCKHCGSENVVSDAYVSWNVETQEWDTVESVFDMEFCYDCEGETTVIDKEINEPERSETA
jgi:hypothetical protein